MWAMSEPSGPIENGTTYIVRPRMQPRKSGGVPSGWPVWSSARISAGAFQLLVGPASSSRSRADEGAVLDAGDVARAAARQEAARPQRRVELDEGAGGDELLAQAVVLGDAAVAPVDVARLGEGGHLGDPVDQLGVADMRRGCASRPDVARRFSGDAVMTARRKLSAWAEQRFDADGKARPVSGTGAGASSRRRRPSGSRLVGGVSAAPAGASQGIAGSVALGPRRRRTDGPDAPRDNGPMVSRRALLTACDRSPVAGRRPARSGRRRRRSVAAGRRPRAHGLRPGGQPAARLRRQHGMAVRLVPGAALAVLDAIREGEVDAALLDVPDAEADLERQGLVHDRRAIAQGEFLLVGPSPAPVRGRRPAQPGRSGGRGAGTHPRPGRGRSRQPRLPVRRRRLRRPCRRAGAVARRAHRARSRPGTRTPTPGGDAHRARPGRAAPTPWSSAAPGRVGRRAAGRAGRRRPAAGGVGPRHALVSGQPPGRQDLHRLDRRRPRPRRRRRARAATGRPEPGQRWRSRQRSAASTSPARRRSRSTAAR